MKSPVQILNNIYTDTSASLSLTSSPWVLIQGPISASTTAPGGGRSDFSGWINTEGYTELSFIARYNSGSLSHSNSFYGLMCSDDGVNPVGGTNAAASSPSFAASSAASLTTSNSGVIIEIGGGVNSGYSTSQNLDVKHVTQGCILPKYVRFSHYYTAGTSNAWQCVWSLYGRRA